MTTDLHELLDELLEIHKAIDTPIADLLRPGLSANEIHALIGAEGIGLPLEGEAFFRWHNGVRTDASATITEAYLVPNQYPMSLVESLSTRRAIINNGDGENLERLLPLFADGVDECFAFDLSRADENSAPIVNYSFVDGEQCAFESLAAMIATILEGMRRGIIFNSHNKYNELDTDFEAYDKLARSMNPGMAYWDFLLAN